MKYTLLFSAVINSKLLEMISKTCYININRYESMKKIITKVEKLIDLYKEGALGGERIPEDSNPNL